MRPLGTQRKGGQDPSGPGVHLQIFNSVICEDCASVASFADLRLNYVAEGRLLRSLNPLTRSYTFRMTVETGRLARRCLRLIMAET